MRKVVTAFSIVNRQLIVVSAAVFHLRRVVFRPASAKARILDGQALVVLENIDTTLSCLAWGL